jgi:hypothetical protein
MDKAAFGLVGVALGFSLTIIKEWWFEKRKNQKTIEFLSIQVVCMLDRFINGCVDVVQDDGLFQGQYHSDGCCHPVVTQPTIEPEKLDVEWKVLPAVLMYEILNFPNEVESANNRIDAEFEFSAFPPDYDEGFEERQYQYALLGLKAYDLAFKLRKLSKLPENTQTGWNPIKFMEEKKLKIEKLRIKRAEENKEMMNKISNNNA